MILVKRECEFIKMVTKRSNFLWKKRFISKRPRLLKLMIFIRFPPSKHSSWWRRLSSSSSEDVFKTSWSRPIYLSWPYVFKTSSRRLQDVFKTFSRRLQDLFKTFWRRLQDLFKASSRRLQDFLKTFQDVFKTSSRLPAKISWRRFQSVPSS